MTYSFPGVQDPQGIVDKKKSQDLRRVSVWSTMTNRSSGLEVHLRSHSREKRHWCPYCGKEFLDYSNLKRHKYTHTGERPYACAHCTKSFVQSGHLKKHLRNVHKVDVYADLQ
ncbi:unnamed protein product [Boreogadus saida]